MIPMMANRFIQYFRDNPKGYWFKRKLYGWGWTPVTWQGWLVVLAAVGLIIWFAVGLGKNPDPVALTRFFVGLGIVIAGMLFICVKKGESPRWQWGPPKR